MSSDIKVRLIEADCYYYPDVVVTCHPEDLQDEEDYIQHPKIVVEVLSKSTQTLNRTEKLIDYQTCPDLEEYVLISQTEQLVEVRTRQPDRWQTEHYKIGDKMGDRIHLKSIDSYCPIETLYQKVSGLSPESAAIP